MNTIIDPASDAKWTLWYEDTFDRECPRQIEATGRGLIMGLRELWRRHLFETIREDGTTGFSRFNLWWEQRAVSISIVGDGEGLRRLRQWVTDEQWWTSTDDAEGWEPDLLTKVAIVHAKLVLQGHTCESIVEAAETAGNLQDFATRLDRLASAR